MFESFVAALYAVQREIHKIFTEMLMRYFKLLIYFPRLISQVLRETVVFLEKLE